MANRTTGSRFNLGDPWDSELADFCEAHHGAPATRILRAALKAFIEAEIGEDQGLARRYEEARRKRLGLVDSENVHVLKQPKD